jgi:hypothetical protein
MKIYLLCSYNRAWVNAVNEGSSTNHFSVFEEEEGKRYIRTFKAVGRDVLVRDSDSTHWADRLRQSGCQPHKEGSKWQFQQHPLWGTS